MYWIALLAAAAQDMPAPPDLDAVAAAPANHKIILENERVRVLEVVVAPGETEPAHEHRWPSIIHIQSAQPAIDIKYAVRDGKLVETGRVRFEGGNPPPALWVPREAPHAVQNLGTKPYRLIRVELKEPPSAAR
jgi:hypothetical protein